VLAELHRDPARPLGEYLELQNRSGSPLNLRGLRVSGNLGAFTVDAPYRLLPGARLLLFAHGDPTNNGGLPFGHCWPYRGLALGNGYDTLRLTHGGRTVDALSYTTGFAGGRGRAAERVDVLASSTAANFRAATSRYGTDFGTPAERNSVDTTRWPLMAGVEVLTANAPGGRGLHFFNSAFSDVLKLDASGLSTGTSPGIVVGSVRIPLNPDPLFLLTVQLPEFMGYVPPNGMRAFRLPVPPGLTGTGAFLGHFLLDPFGRTPVPSTSPAAGFRFP
jgi:hypothetical protein